MAGHNNVGKHNDGKQFAGQLVRARDDIDTFANEIEDDYERREYLALIEGVRAELRMLDRLRSRREHALEDAEVCAAP